MNLEYYAIGNVTIHLNGPENFSTDHIRLFSWVTSFHFQSLEVVFPHMGVSLFISLTTKPINLTLISIIIAILFSSIFHHVNIHLSYTIYWFNTNSVRSQLFYTSHFRTPHLTKLLNNIERVSLFIPATLILQITCHPFHVQSLGVHLNGIQCITILRLH